LIKIINCGNYYTLINCKGDYNNHCHVDKKSTAELLKRLVQNKRVPRSSYLRQSAIRLTTDTRYKENIKIKINKDKNKQKYTNKMR